jgi:hypothetical protein
MLQRLVQRFSNAKLRLSDAGRFRWIAVLLVTGVLAAQTISLLHELDPSAHTSDQSCEICVASSVLGGANIASPITLSFDRQSDPFPRIEAERFFSTTPHHFEARAPPFAS